MAFSAAEASYIWGGDLAIAPNGDFVVLTGAAALQQRVIQLIMTNAMDVAYGPLGNKISLLPDDLFNPTYGSSVRRLIGKNATQALLDEIQARILAAFTTDPNIATSPAPSVNVSAAGGHVVINEITVYDTSGKPVVIPTQAIPVFSAVS